MPNPSLLRFALTVLLFCLGGGLLLVAIVNLLRNEDPTAPMIVGIACIALAIPASRRS